MMSAKAVTVVIRTPLGIFIGVFVDFLSSDSASNCASVETCVDVGFGSCD